MRELSLLRQLEHPCVVKLLDVVVPDDLFGFNELYLVFEHEKNDLRKM